MYVIYIKMYIFSLSSFRERGFSNKISPPPFLFAHIKRERTCMFWVFLMTTFAGRGNQPAEITIGSEGT